MGFSRLAQILGKLAQTLGLSAFFRVIFDSTIYPRIQNRRSKSIRACLEVLRDKAALSDERLVMQALQALRVEHRIHNPIRVGSHEDGGYVAPREIFEVEALFSPGVAQSSSFELEFAEKGIACFLADASVSGPAVEHELFTFDKVFLGPSTREGWISLDDWLKKYNLGSSRNLAMQMDIEGGEWDLLQQVTVESIDAFRFILIELHILDKLWHASEVHKMTAALQVLTANHDVVHIHGNNYDVEVDFAGVRFPRTLELTLVRKGDGSTSSKSGPFSSKSLDSPNNPRLREVPLGSLSF